MREVIAVCRSGKKSRVRTAQVLDRYFWRIGDRTWRGQATNACLDRVSRELRSRATRNTAVTIQEVRSSHQSRAPLIRIGARASFSDEGLTPIGARPAQLAVTSARTNNEHCAASVVRIAVLFHDLGKATTLFQAKLSRALTGVKGEADAVRHELFSAAVWDNLVGRVSDDDLAATLISLTPEAIDDACQAVVRQLRDAVRAPTSKLTFKFLDGDAGPLAHAIGMLILTHHRLPEGGSDHMSFLAKHHIGTMEGSAGGLRDLLKIQPGTPFWHEDWWLRRLKRDAAKLSPSGGKALTGVDLVLRASMMFADHLGSSRSQPTPGGKRPEHLANTTKNEAGKSVAADSLSLHIQRVYGFCRSAFDLFHRHREQFPALEEAQLPVDIALPQPAADPRFAWQAEAALAARRLCQVNEGGFFGCILAGTGTGKTRAAPTILANAALADTRPERRHLRMSLGLGLRVLASQSAREYVDDLGFAARDVSVLIGQSPVQFLQSDRSAEGQSEMEESGSESLLSLPDWLRVEQLTGGPPEEGSEKELDWLRSLSLNTDRGLPAFCDMLLEAAGARAGNARQMLVSPIMVGTIDHLMAVATPVRSRFLLQSLRVVTSDLILDEIDQYDGEDIAAIGRLVFQAGAGGRRVLIMSATLTADIAAALHDAYRKGWVEYARMHGLAKRVNVLCTGDAPGSCLTSEGGEDLSTLLSSCQVATLAALSSTPPIRRAEMLPPSESWADLISQIDQSCSQLHQANAVEIGGFRVSVGMVRLTRIAHTAAVTAQLPAGKVNDSFRVKLCLHSQFPRLHRTWIEQQLKRALTRKGQEPEAGLLALCTGANLFHRAAAVGARDIEIVVLTSPVIETGNDLDFDYAVLDPISIRSIIQAAGRVRRHRPPVNQKQPNIHILGRSAVAMGNADGSLSHPGVETKPDKDTVVGFRSLNAWPKRAFIDLAGECSFDVISAALLLDDSKVCPLREEEQALRQAMISTEPTAPLGLYISQLPARLNRAMTQSRKFRRSTTGDIEFVLRGDALEDAVWHIDIAPGTRESQLNPAEASLALTSCHDTSDLLFENLGALAWADYCKGREDRDEIPVHRHLRLTVSDYSRTRTTQFSYAEVTGITKGRPEDLFEPFGKSLGKQ